MVYDQIVISRGVYHEFGDGLATMRSRIGIVEFDTAMENEGFDFETIKDLVSDHRPIWAQFRIDLGDDDGTSVGIKSSALPSEFKVQHPYPNPFNPTTTIQYEIPETNYVKLVIYDILGRKIAVLQNEIMHAGIHKVTWDGRNTNGGLTGSGIYFYQLVAGDYKAQGKVLFLR